MAGKRGPKKVKTTEQILAQVCFTIPEVVQVSSYTASHLRDMIKTKELSAEKGHFRDAGTGTQSAIMITRKGFTFLTGHTFSDRPEVDLPALARALLNQIFAEDSSRFSQRKGA